MSILPSQQVEAIYDMLSDHPDDCECRLCLMLEQLESDISVLYTECLDEVDEE